MCSAQLQLCLASCAMYWAPQIQAKGACETRDTWGLEILKAPLVLRSPHLACPISHLASWEQNVRHSCASASPREPFRGLVITGSLQVATLEAMSNSLIPSLQFSKRSLTWLHPCAHLITKGNPSIPQWVALRSRGEGGQPCYLIIKDWADCSSFQYPPLRAPHAPYEQSQNIVIDIQFFVPFGYRHYILQHGETCVNTSVFARCWPKKYCQYCDSCYQMPKKIVNTAVLGFRRFRPAKNIGIYCCSESCKNTRKHKRYEDFRPLRHWEISFGGIPSSQQPQHFILTYIYIYLSEACCQALEPSPEPCWTWPGCTKGCTKASQTFSGTFSATLSINAPKPPRTFSEIFSGKLLNLAWLCTKASQSFPGTFFETLLILTWLCTKAFRNLQLVPEPCWTWSGFAPKPPRPSPNFSGPCWIWPGSAPKPPRTFSGSFSGTLLNLTWLCTKASHTFSGFFSGTFSGTMLNHVEPDLALHQSLPDLLRNLLRNPVELDLALHQAFLEPFPEPSPESCWTWLGFAPRLPGTFSGTCSRTLLDLTWLCTKSLPEPSPESVPEPCWTWPDFAPKLPRPSPEPFLKPCWTWPGSAPKPPRPSPDFSSDRCWSWPGFAPKLPGTFSRTFSGTLLNLTWLCTKASQTFSGFFSGTFSGTLLNHVEPDLALHQSLPDLLQNLHRNPVEPDLALHQAFLEPFPEPSPESVEPDLALHQSLPDLFQNLFRNPVELDLSLHQSLPDLRNPTGLNTNAGTFGAFSRTSLNLTRRLHQCTPELFRAEDWRSH